MNTLITRSLLAASVLIAAPLAAQAADAPAAALALAGSNTSSSPIRLDSVQIAPSAGWQNNFAYPGLVTVAFTNTNALPVSSIAFTLLGRDGSIIGHITDVGNYAPGQTVRHSFVDNAIDPQQQLEVDTATFADGSVWTNPGPVAAPVSRRQAR